jgi:hypothetical protein
VDKPNVCWSALRGLRWINRMCAGVRYVDSGGDAAANACIAE